MQKAIETLTDKTYGIFNPLTQEPLPIVGTVKHLENNPIIVGPKELGTLLNPQDCARTDNKECKIVRFVVRNDGEVVFAPEGVVGRLAKHIPTHGQMASEDYLNYHSNTCMTAGNMFFNKNNALCIINNQSGDFRPPFDSLQFAITAVTQSSIPLAEKIEINNVDEHEEDKAEQYFLQPSDILPKQKIQDSLNQKSPFRPNEYNDIRHYQQYMLNYSTLFFSLHKIIPPLPGEKLTTETLSTEALSLG